MTNEHANNTENEETTERPPIVTSPFARERAVRIGDRVLFIESGNVHAADVCYVNEDDTVNLRVLGHQGETFARTNVKNIGGDPDLTDRAVRRQCEQRWIWP